MKKLIIIIAFVLTFILLSFNVKAIPINYCTGAALCSASYNLDCKSVADGFCPEIYGDWSGCVNNNYGGKCRPCDPDCGVCDIVTSLSIECSPVTDPGGQVTVIASAQTTAGDELRIYKGTLPTGTPWKTKFCTTNRCETTEKDTAPNQGGATFYYTTTTRNLLAQGRYTTSNSCSTRPLCDVNIPGNEINGQVDVQINVQSEKGVKQAELYFYKWNTDLNEFSKMTPPDQGCSIRACTSQDCNKLTIAGNQQTELKYTYTWDTTKCENERHRITLTGTNGNINTCTDTDEATVANLISASPERAGIFTSEILNTIIVKIRSWL